MGLMRRNLGLGRKMTPEELTESDKKYEENMEKARAFYEKTGILCIGDPTGKSFMEMIEDIKKDPACISDWNGSKEDYEEFIDNVKAGKYDFK